MLYPGEGRQDAGQKQQLFTVADIKSYLYPPKAFIVLNIGMHMVGSQ